MLTKGWRVKGSLLVIVQLEVEVSDSPDGSLEFLLDLIPQFVVSCVAHLLAPINLINMKSVQLGIVNTVLHVLLSCNSYVLSSKAATYFQKTLRGFLMLHIEKRNA